MPDAPQVEFRGIAETLERCKVLGISATRYLFTHSEVTSLIAAVRADERAALASQADAGDREVVEAALADLARVLVPATKAGLGAVESRKAKAIEVILSRLAALRAEVRDLTGICRHLAADRDALAQRVGEVEKVVAAAQRWYDGDDTVLAEAVQAYRAALAGRKVRPAGAEQREGA